MRLLVLGGTRFVGRAVVTDAITRGWDDPAADTDAKQDRVWLRLRMQDRQSGPFLRYRDGELDQAVPPTGRLIDFEQIHLLTLHGGQVVHHEAVRDDTTMLAQLGVFPPSPAVALRAVVWKVSGRAA